MTFSVKVMKGRIQQEYTLMNIERRLGQRWIGSFQLRLNRLIIVQNQFSSKKLIKKLEKILISWNNIEDSEIEINMLMLILRAKDSRKRKDLSFHQLTQQQEPSTSH